MAGRNRLVLGPTQGGKTWYVHEYLYKPFPVDTGGVALFVAPKWTDYLSWTEAHPEGYLFRHTAAFARARTRPRWALLRSALDTDVGMEASDLIESVLALKFDPVFARVPVLLVVDECHRFMSKMRIEVPAIGRAVAEGRAYEISTVLINQHPNRIPNDLILNCDTLQIFGAQAEGHAAVHPIIADYWENFSGKLSPEQVGWLERPHHSLLTNFSSISYVDDHGQTKRSELVRRRREEDGDHGDDREGTGVPEGGQHVDGAGPLPEVDPERPAVQAVGSDGPGHEGTPRPPP